MPLEFEPGLGQDPLGVPPVGLASGPVPPRYSLEPIAAKKLDPAAKEWVVNSDGQYVGDSPVIQWAIMQVTLVRGSIPSAMGLGNPSHDYTHITESHAETVRKRIQSRLNIKVAAGELQIHQLVVETYQTATLVGLDISDLTTGKRTGFIKV